MSHALVLLAKYPEPGTVKTRLVVGTSENQYYGLQDACLANGERLPAADAYVLSAELFKAFLIDRFNAHRGRAYDLILGTSQPERVEAFRTITGNGVCSHQVTGSNLGEMMCEAFRTLLPQYAKVIISGSDFPYLPESIIDRMYRQLDTHEVVLVPACDGAYNMVGMSRLHNIFTIPAWSSGSELRETVALLQRQSIPYAVLDDVRLLDIDTMDDLAILMRTLQPDQAPVTFAKLQELRDRLRLTTSV
ncbi:MAG: DUF2064 domain-containing protein [Candidatus Latescibacteria bacterium]|nr:DUF2064 domain-containing protein [Candidatus Latescibacterota bacterium]